jgi:hypothetical protein
MATLWQTGFSQPLTIDGCDVAAGDEVGAVVNGHEILTTVLDWDTARVLVAFGDDAVYVSRADLIV